MSGSIVKIVRVGALSLSLMALAACGDDKNEANNEGEPHGDGDHHHQDGNNDGGVTDDASTPEADPYYALAVQVISGETATTYIVGSDTVAHVPLSLEGATVLNGRGIVASGGGGVFFAGSSLSPVVTRYSVNDAGAIVKGPELNFQAQGIAGIGEYQSQFQFVSQTKAYYFDGKTSQAVVFNPEAMTVTGSIDLKALASADHVVAFSSMPARRGSELVMPVGFRSKDNAKIVSGAAVVIIDVNDDSLVIARDDRCGYVRDAAVTADGTIYLATEAYGSAVYRINPANAPEPCLLRIAPDTKAFDASFYVKLNPLSGGSTVASLVLSPSGKAYTHVLDELLVDVSGVSSARALASANAWQWSEITLGDAPALTPSTTLPPSAGSIIAFPVEGDLLVAEFVNFFESTKLRKLSDGSGATVLDSQGMVFSVAQVR